MTHASQDLAWIHDFAEFNNNINATTVAAYPHASIKSSFYWAWNGDQYQALGLVNAVCSPSPSIHTHPFRPLSLGVEFFRIFLI